jgi:hypothetical protein
MLTMLRARGLAVMDRDEQPAIVRVVIGTTGRVPSWPPSHDRPRLLLEAPGGHWHHEDAARAAGFEVLACPGQLRGWAHCPALRGEPCPLVAGADVIVDAQPGERGRALLGAHRRLRPTVPSCVEVPATADELGTDVSLIAKDASDTVVVGLLQRLAEPAPTGPGERPSDEPG